MTHNEALEKLRPLIAVYISLRIPRYYVNSGPVFYMAKRFSEDSPHEKLIYRKGARVFLQPERREQRQITLCALLRKIGSAATAQ